MFKDIYILELLFSECIGDSKREKFIFEGR